MKLLKVKVYISKSADGLTKNYIKYPEGWEANSKIPFILYTGEEGVDANGLFEWIVPCMEEEVYTKLSAHPACQDITNAEAIALSDLHTPKKPFIKDRDLVLAVIDKVKKKVNLSLADENNIDPDKNAGVGWTKTAVDLWRRHGVII